MLVLYTCRECSSYGHMLNYWLFYASSNLQCLKNLKYFKHFTKGLSIHSKLKGDARTLNVGVQV